MALGLGAALGIGAAVQGIGSIASGILGSNAASGASGAQAQANQKAAERLVQTLLEQKRYIEQARGDIQAGMDYSLGQYDALSPVLAQLQGQQEGALRTQYGNAITGLQGMMGQYDPYVQSGLAGLSQYSNLLGLNGADPTETLRNTPGYQFALDEAMGANDRRLSALGLTDSGNAVDETLRLALGFADQTYNQQLANYSGIANLGYNALGAQTGIQNNISGIQQALGSNLATHYGNQQNTAMNLAQLKANTATQGYGSLANLWQDFSHQEQAFGGQLSQLMSGTGAAQAAGAINSANAWSGAIQGVGNAINSGLTNYLIYSGMNGGGLGTGATNQFGGSMSTGAVSNAASSIYGW